MDPLSIATTASTVALFATSLFRPNFSSHKHEEILQAASLLNAEYCRAVHLLQRLSATYSVNTGAAGDTEQYQRLLLMMKDVNERLSRAQEALSHCHKPSEVSFQFGLTQIKARRTSLFRNGVKWASVKKDVLLQLHTCVQLNDAISFCTEQRDSDTLKMMLEMAEESRALSRSQTTLLEGRLKAFETRAQQRKDTALINKPQVNEASEDPEETHLLPGQSKTAFTTVQQLGLEPVWNLASLKTTSDDGLALVLNPVVTDGGRAALLKPMYDLATEGLFIISRVLASAEIARLYDRLKMWGRGLFHGSYDLTKMLAEYPDYSTDANDGQCSAFHNSFIIILLEIGTVPYRRQTKINQTRTDFLSRAASHHFPEWQYCCGRFPKQVE